MSNTIQPKSIPSNPQVSSPDINTAIVQMNETTFLQLAQRLGISEELLRQANPNVDPQKISAGQEIKLPESRVAGKAEEPQEGPGPEATSSRDAGAKVAEQRFASLGRQSQLLATTGSGGIGGPTPQDKVNDLAEAALDGDLKKVEALIKSGADVNGKDSNVHWTPLTHALTAGNQQIAELLIKNGARVDEPMNDGHTALTTLAKRDGDPAMIDFLIKNGANKDHKDVSGRTALKYAAENGNKDVLDVLLKGGADPNIPDGDKRTPLMEAAKKNNKEIVDLLLGGKANPNVPPDKDGNTPLIEAAKHQDKTPDVIKSLLDKGADPNKTDAIGHTVLWELAKKGDSESVKALLAANAKPDVKDPVSDTTPLMESAKTGDLESVKALLDKKANANFKDGFDRTPLMEAAKSGNTEVVKLLVEKGAKGNTKDKANTTALQEAVALDQTDPEMIKALLKSNADPNVQDKNKRTPLMELASKGDHASITALKQKGAKLDVQDVNGRTALMEAAAQGNKRAVAALVGSDDYTNLVPPWADFKKTDLKGDTALSLAKKALAQPTITSDERDAGKQGITAYERQNYERVVEILEKAAKRKP